LAFDASGNLFVTDFHAGTIVKIAPAGVKSTFASGLSGPWSLAFDGSGNLFVGNDAATIWKFTPGGSKSTFASTGLNAPEGLAFDASGNLFVANFSLNNIVTSRPLEPRAPSPP